MNKIQLPQIVKRGKDYWIPACPPHYLIDVGPYDTKKDAESDRKGMTTTINSKEWQEVINESTDNNP